MTPLRNEVKDMVGRVAMGDLVGASEPPEGVPDRYPFNACAWRDWFCEEHSEWYDELDNVIAFVYHNERMPDNGTT